MPRRAAACLVAVVVVACGSAPIPDSTTPPGIVVVTSAGAALDDGAADVTPTLDLLVSAGRPLAADEVSAVLDGHRLALSGTDRGAVSTRVPVMPLGSAHRLELGLPGQGPRAIGFHVVAPARAAAAIHRDLAGATTLDLVFDLAPDRASVEAALPTGSTPAWIDTTHLTVTWPAAPGGELRLPAGLATARGSHLGASLDLVLTGVDAGSLRRASTDSLSPAVPPPTVVAFSVGTAASRASVAAHAGQISVVSPTGLHARGDGSLSGDPDQGTVAVATAAGLPVWPVVQNEGFDTAEVGRLLRDSAAVGRLVEALRAVASRPGYGGINLDLEEVDPADRDGLSQLVRRLHDALHQDGHRLTVDVVPHKPGHINAHSAAYDLRAIAAASEMVTVMAYEQHGSDATRGAVDGRSWVDAVLAGTLPDLAAERTLLGLSVYARSWSATGRTADGYAPAVADALAKPGARVDYDFVEAAPSISNADGTVTYFDDRLSLTTKLALVGPRHLAGIAVWRLGFEDPAFWTLLQATARRG